MAISLAWRDMLPTVVVQELDQLVAGIRGFLFTEHHEDGSHSDVTADSVTVREQGSIKLALPPNADTDVPAELKVESSDPESFTLIVPKQLRVTPGEVVAGLVEVFSSISGVRRPGVGFGDDVGAREKWAWFSDSDGFDSFAALTNLKSRDAALAVYHVDGSDTFIVAPPFTTTHTHQLGDESDSRLRWDKIVGTVVRGHTGFFLGTRTVAEGHWQTYTPTVMGTVGNPSGFSATGRYAVTGKIVNFRVVITPNSGWSAGSGSYLVSLPIARGASGGLTGQWFGIDATAGTFLGQLAQGSFVGGGSSTFTAFVETTGGPPTVASAWSGTSPFTIANGDNFVMMGWYEID